MLIQVDDLIHVYASGTSLAQVALRGVSIEIGPGERVGILGRTGSGKSTLVQHLAGLLTPTSGRVRLDGIVAHKRTRAARARRRRVGLAFQYPEDQIFERTVFREVAFGLRNMAPDASCPLDEGKIAARVHWALEMVGLDPAAVEKRSPFTLSGGEMRRVALAAILSMRPEVLILDEPTAGLDPQGRRETLARVQAWQSETGQTLILVSHDMGELARVVERVLLLDGGQIVADGPARRVLGDGDLLHAVGLDVLPPVALLQTLRKAGWAVRTDRLSPEEAAVEIARVQNIRRAQGLLGARA